MPAATDSPLPVVRVGDIPRQQRPYRWLVEPLWGASSVGIIGGAPKCAKTWLGLDLALSVASGTACLGALAVPEAGPVVVYLAEDALPIVRQRVEGMARHRGLDLGGVEMYAITVPSLRLDQQRHRRQLQQTIQRLRPRLLLLDPLVRLHGIDENSAAEVAALLAYKCSRGEEFARRCVSRTNVSARPWNTWSTPANCAARLPAGNAPTDVATDRSRSP